MIALTAAPGLLPAPHLCFLSRRRAGSGFRGTQIVAALQEAAQLFSARTAVRHAMALPQADERAAYLGPVLAALALPPPPPPIESPAAAPPQACTLTVFLCQMLLGVLQPRSRTRSCFLGLSDPACLTGTTSSVLCRGC